MARGTCERAAEQALGRIGLLLVGLVGWAASRGRPGRVVIWLVSAIGWAVDRAHPNGVRPPQPKRAARRTRAKSAGMLRGHVSGDTLFDLLELREASARRIVMASRRRP